MPYRTLVRSVKIIVILDLVVCLSLPAVAGTIIGAQSRVPADPRQEYARFVRFRPTDGQVVTLNSPRFSWPSVPTIIPRGTSVAADQLFTLQISSTRDFGDPYVEVKDTDCNFYSFLPELKGSQTWHWRVGYSAGTESWPTRGGSQSRGQWSHKHA